MSLHHFFLKKQILKNEIADDFVLELSPEDAKHARVLRLEAGEHISVVDGSQDYFECEIVSHDENGLRVRIAQKLELDSLGASVYLVQGMAKGDKMDDIIRHTTEVGIAGFVPLLCDRSIVKLDAKKTKARMQRWETIAKSAAMQSGRLTIPEIVEPLTVKQSVEFMASMDVVLVCWEESLQGNIRTVLQEATNRLGVGVDTLRIAVVVGPEGGLSAAEVDMIRELDQCRVITLGNTILRTETAGIVAPSLVLYECGGLGNSAQ